MVAETPPHPRRSRTRARIRAAALELFGERGFGGTSMRDVAARVGCTTAALYYHFDGKDALLADLVAPFLDEVEGLLDGSPEPASARHVLASYLDLLLDHVAVVQLLQRDGAVRAHPALAVRYDAHVDRLHEHLAGGERGAETSARVAASLGALRGPVLRSDLDPTGLRDVILAAAVAALEPAAAAP